MQLSQVRFSNAKNETNPQQDEFYKVLRKRVNNYFKENGISRHANTNMVVKTIFMISLYFIPFILMLTLFESTGLVLLMWVLMGFGMAGIGLSIMHDANHNAYSKNNKVNWLLGKLLLPIGGSDVNWRIQHNVLHHTYTNVTGMDEDIDTGVLMRFSPNQKLRKGHKLQHVYAWFLYGFMTIMWFSSKDYSQLARYKKKDLLKTQGVTFRGMLVSIILTKVVYLSVFLVLPMILSSLPWWGTILGFFMMHFIAGLTLAMIFQPAHVIPSSNYPMPDKTGNIESDWAVSQLMNTANFAPKSTWFSWYVGGLNFQVEHHLFPNICHVHYRKISHIVRETAFEYNLPYYSYKTFADALFEHGKMLYRLGRKEPKVALAKTK
ncbi:MAG: fatty acid desaturase [Flavobacteriales bacterium]|nr:fatty acid desaturase [Flavobacteriales bacterium]